MKIKQFRTQRLVLCKLSLRYLADFNQYAKHPLVGPNAGWEPHTSLEHSEFILTSLMVANETWAIVLRENKKMIGTISIQKKGDNRYELGYCLAFEQWNKGYMGEATKVIVRYFFDKFKGECLWVSHFPNNYRSKKVIERLGFNFVGEEDTPLNFKKYSKTYLMYKLTREQFKENQHVRNKI